MTYDKLLQQYLKTVPNAEVNSPEGQAGFNAWAGQLAQQTGAKDWESIPDNSFGNPFVSDTLQGSIDQALQNGVNQAAQGGNTNQVQGGFQQGTFNTNGTQQQSGTNKQEGVVNSAGQTNVSGTSTQAGSSNTQGTTATTQNQTTTANGVRKVDDSLGFGRLLQSQAGNAVANDRARTGFLTDVMNTGGTQFQDQVDFSANRALSGPGMTGVGNGAKGRVAGSAVADVARNSMNQRLQAASGLAGPTAVGNLVEKGNPYLGDSTSSTANTAGTSVAVNNQNTQFNQSGTNTANTNTAGHQASSSLGLTDLLSKENNTGTSNAATTQIATGQVPEGKTTSGGGGCMVCTAFVDMGTMHPIAVRRGVNFKLKNLHKYRNNVSGYMLYGPSIVKLVRRSSLAARLVQPLARGILYEECRLASRTRLRFRLRPFLSHQAFVWISNVFAVLGRATGHSGRVEDVEVETMLKRNDLFFTWN